MNDELRESLQRMASYFRCDRYKNKYAAIRLLKVLLQGLFLVLILIGGLAVIIIKDLVESILAWALGLLGLITIAAATLVGNFRRNL